MYSTEYEDNGSDLEDFIVGDDEIDYERFEQELHFEEEDEEFNDEEFYEEEEEEKFNEEDFDETDFEESPFYDYDNEQSFEDEDENDIVLVNHNSISSINIHNLTSTQPLDIFRLIQVIASMNDRDRGQYNPNFVEDEDEEEDWN
jgi:hypothetical protein